MRGKCEKEETNDYLANIATRKRKKTETKCVKEKLHRRK